MTVDWKSLRGHIATGGQIPAYLKALVSIRGQDSGELESKRGGAYNYLVAQLVERGKWLPACPPAAAELVNLARSDQPGRWRVLRLLGELVSGNHLWWLEQGLNKKRKADKLEVATRAAALPLREDACRLLVDPDPALRSSAAFFLACLNAPSVATLTQLATQLGQERDLDARASQLLALAVLQAGQGNVEIDLRPYLDTQSQASLVVGVAALAALLGGLLTPRDLGNKILRLSTLSKEPAAAYPELSFCWGGDYLDDLENAVVRGLGGKVIEETIDVLLAELPSCASALKPVYMKRLLTYGGFDSRWENSDRALLEELTPRQREIAEVLASAGPANEYGHGLPKTKRFLTRWIGREPPGLLDEMVEVQVQGKRQSRPRWWAWRNAATCRIKEKDIDAFVLGLDVKDQLRLIVDCLEYSSGISSPSLQLPRVVDLVEQLPIDSAAWAIKWATELMRAPYRDSEAGPMICLASNAGYAVLRASLRMGVPIEPEWVVFTPWSKPHVRTVLEQLSTDLRELGTYRNLLLNKQVAAEYLVPMLELFPSRRIIEKMLELSQPSETGSSPLMNASTREAFASKLAELAKSNPEIGRWVAEWPAKWQVHMESRWYESLVKKPWDNAVFVAELLPNDWCSRRIIEALLDLESNEDADPSDLRALKSALQARLPRAYEKRPEMKEWVEAWEQTHKSLGKVPAKTPAKEPPDANSAKPAAKPAATTAKTPGKVSPKPTATKAPPKTAAKPTSKKAPSKKK
jgi:hypothetical protein